MNGPPRARAPSPSPRRAALEDLALTVVFSAIFLLHAAHYLGTWVDDAFITFRYGRHLLEGAGPVFNPGERLEGITDLAWCLLIAPFTHGDPLLAARLLGLGAGVGTVALLVRAARREGLGPAGGAIAAGTWALLPWGPFWAVQGLETAMVAFLVTLAWSRPADERLPWAGLGAALAPAFHPISSGLVALIAAGQILRHGPRAVIRPALVVLAGAAALIGAKLAWYGAILPNTFAVKTRPWPWPNGAIYVENFLREPGWPWGVVLVAALGAALLEPLIARLRGRSSAMAPATLPAVVVLGALGTAWAVNGDLFANYRLMVPALPAAGLVLGALGAALARRVGGVLVLAAAAWLLVPVARTRSVDGLALGTPRIETKTAPLWRPDQGPDWGRGLAETWAFPSAWVLVHVPTERTVAFTDIGLFSYLAPHRVVDLLGLCTGPLVKGRNEAPAAAFARMADWVRDEVDYAIVDQGSDRYASMRLSDRRRWERVAGCGEVITVRRMGLGEETVALDELARRLETVLTRTPSMPGLHVAVARELAHIGQTAAPLGGEVGSGGTTTLLEDFVTRAEDLAGQPLAFYWRQAQCELGLGEGCAPVDACGGAAAQTRW